MRPPGDHAGSKSCAGLVVRRRSLVPLALIVQMSSVLLEKVILPGRADTSIGALAREAGGAGWLLAGGAGPDPRPGCPAPGVVQAADSTSSTPSPAVTRGASRSDLTGRPSHETFTCHTPKLANGFPKTGGPVRSDGDRQRRLRACSIPQGVSRSATERAHGTCHGCAAARCPGDWPVTAGCPVPWLRRWLSARAR